MSSFEAFAEIKRVAVLEFRGVDIERAILLKLSDQARLAGLKVLPKSRYEIMTRENMMQILKDNGKDASCIEGSCEVEVGRNIGADIIVLGDLMKMDGVYYLTLKLYETRKGTLLAGQDVEATMFGSLKEQTYEQAIFLFEEGLALAETKETLSRKSSVDREGKGNAIQDDVEIKGNTYKAVLIPAGTFMMGCTSGQSKCDSDERQPHGVTISKNFYMMKSEVTQDLYQEIMGTNPSHFKGSDRPVEKVSWYDAVKFANKLSQQEGLEQCYSISGNNTKWSNKDCNGWRLPTEAEWEYAARGGQSYKYAGSDDINTVAWHRKNTQRKTQEVCLKDKNGYNLCDMSGNVWEWIWDRKGDYPTSFALDPTGTSVGEIRVIRGGSWRNHANLARISNRYGYSTEFHNFDIGFRLVRVP